MRASRSRNTPGTGRSTSRPRARSTSKSICAIKRDCRLIVADGPTAAWGAGKEDGEVGARSGVAGVAGVATGNSPPPAEHAETAATNSTPKRKLTRGGSAHVPPLGERSQWPRHSWGGRISRYLRRARVHRHRSRSRRCRAKRPHRSPVKRPDPFGRSFVELRALWEGPPAETIDRQSRG